MLATSQHGPITRIRMARTFFSKPLYEVSAYLVDGLLIDTGCPGTVGEMVAWARAAAIRCIINTHHHEDHAGGDRALKEALGVPVLASRAAAPILAAVPRPQFYRRMVWGDPVSVRVDTLGECVETEHYRFEVVPTPGHSPDHVCLLERSQGWMFTGDLFIHEYIKFLRADEDAREIVRSLRKAIAMRPRVVICAHAGLVEDGTGVLQRKAAYWEGLAEQARTLADQGLDIAAITRRVLGREGAMSWYSRGHFSKRNLIASLLG